MKKICLALFGVLFAMTAYAADIHLKWDPSSGNVTGYRLYMSEDQGQTWTILKDNIPGTVTEANVTVPDHKLLLIRASAYNSFGESIRTNAGVFYNSDWTKPKSPSGTGVR